MLWAHQQQAADAAAAELAGSERTQIVAACGTGKTVIGAEVSRRIAPHAPVLVVVPTLELLAQTARSYASHLGPAIGRLGAVCSQAGATIDAADMHRELAAAHAGVSTDPATVAGWIAARGRCTILCTYQSLPVIYEAHRGHGAPGWGLIVVDEAHRSAGRTDRPWHIVHGAIPARRRLYMTATPRIMGESGYESASMDDPAVFGREAYHMSFGRAIEAGLLADYRVIVSVVTDQDIHALLYRTGAVLDVGGATAPAAMVAAQIALLKAARQYNLRRAITYHRRVLSAAKFAALLPAVARLLPEQQRPGHVHCDWVSGEMSLDARRAALARLQQPGEGLTALANARVLGEGVDVPTLDAVMFTDPRESPTDIAQAVGRALRRGPHSGKTATIIIPLLVAQAEADAAALEGSAYDTVWRTVRALRAHDERLADWLDSHRVRLTSEDKPHHPARLHQAPPWLTLVGDALPPGFADAITTRIVQSASSAWWATYGLAAAYRRRTGHLAPDRSGDPKLYNFVVNNRHLRAQGRLPADRITALDALGIVWDRAEQRWRRLLEEAEDFRREHGHLRVPQDYRSASGLRLGNRFNTVRRTGPERVPVHVREQLDRLGMLWSVPDAAFEQLLLHAAAWRAGHGSLAMGRGQWHEGYPLGAALAGKRTAQEHGYLPGYQRTALDALGMVWTSARDRSWDAFLGACRRYLAAQRANGVAHPVLDAPRDYVDARGYRFGRALNYYRTLNNGAKTSRGTRLSLPQERRKILGELGMLWQVAPQRRAASEQELARLRAMPAGRARSREHRALTAAIIELVDQGVTESSIADGLGVKRPTLHVRIRSLRENPHLGVPGRNAPVPAQRARPADVAPTRPDLVPAFRAPAPPMEGRGAGTDPDALS